MGTLTITAEFDGTWDFDKMMEGLISAGLYDVDFEEEA